MEGKMKLKVRGRWGDESGDNTLGGKEDKVMGKMEKEKATVRKSNCE